MSAGFFKGVRPLEPAAVRAQRGKASALRHGWLLAHFWGRRGIECYECTENTARGWGREYNGIAVLLTILQRTEGYINGTAGI